MRVLRHWLNRLEKNAFGRPHMNFPRTPSPSVVVTWLNQEEAVPFGLRTGSV
jgi:hypothetical protein